MGDIQALAKGGFYTQPNLNLKLAQDPATRLSLVFLIGSEV